MTRIKSKNTLHKDTLGEDILHKDTLREDTLYKNNLLEYTLHQILYVKILHMKIL